MLSSIQYCFYVCIQRLWAGSSIDKNKGMVAHLKGYGVIQSDKVAEIMETVDRALFVPDGSPAYEDSPMQIGFNATISAPHMHATCLQLLEKNLQPGMHALDVGSGILLLLTFFISLVYDASLRFLEVQSFCQKLVGKF